MAQFVHFCDDLVRLFSPVHGNTGEMSSYTVSVSWRTMELPSSSVFQQGAFNIVSGRFYFSPF